MNSDTLIRVEGVSKKFCRSLKRSLWYGLCDMAAELIPFGSGQDPALGGPSPKDAATDTRLRHNEFWAVNDVSFELRRGECLGLIGRNGAGKTTLLRMLNGLIKPDAGRIEMRGRIGALIALGAGFNPILTGRENVYIGCSVLGLTKKEIDAKFDEIVDFAEIGDFIDAPVQSYSSGMAVRLGFAVAAVMQPEILLVDEVLAVGDFRFVTKCYQRIYALKNQGTCIILVSHQMQTVSNFCDRTILFHKGMLRKDGPTPDVIEMYQMLAADESNVPAAASEHIIVRAATASGHDSIRAGDSVKFSIAPKNPIACQDVSCEVAFKDTGGNLLLRQKSGYTRTSDGRFVFELRFDAFPIRVSPVIVGVTVWSGTGGLVAWSPHCATFVVCNADPGLGILAVEGSWALRSVGVEPPVPEW